MENQVKNVEAILGGRNKLPAPLTNRMSFIEVARSGLTKENFESLKMFTNLDVNTLAYILAITPRTIQRKKSREKFQPETSERMLGLAEVYAEGIDIFVEKEKFQKWMESPSIALGGKSPLSLMDTLYGRQLVMDELGRIIYGVYS